MNTYRLANLVLVNIAPLMIMTLAIWQMLNNGTIFTYLKFSTVVFHALTAIALCIAYIVGCVKLRFLPIPLRQIYSLSLVVTGIHLYDFFWGLGSLISRGRGVPWGPLLSLFIASLLLVFLDKLNIFLKTTGFTWIFFTIMIASICIMASTGFYSRMALYDLGIGSDPNINNYWWVLSKFSGFIIMPFSTWKGEEVKEIRWPFT